MLPPSDGRFKVLKRSDKTFIILLSGNEVVMIVYRFNTTYVEDASKDFLNRPMTHMAMAMAPPNGVTPVSPPPNPKAENSKFQ